jgi:hypothetical protein
MPQVRHLRLDERVFVRDALREVKNKRPGESPASSLCGERAEAQEMAMTPH